MAALTLAVLAGCGDQAGTEQGTTEDIAPSSTTTPPTPTARLQQARDTWAVDGPTDYHWRYQRLCFCPPLRPRIEVRSGRAVSAVNRADRDDHQVPEIATMEDLFDLVERALADADKVKVTYDEQTGAVRRLEVDAIKNAVDDEYSYSVHDVTTD